MASVVDTAASTRPLSNRPLHVSELNNILKRSVETAVGRVWVAGEVNGLRPSANGHAYFSLKDEDTGDSIDAVAFRSTAVRFGRDLHNGARVLVLCKPSVWAPRGRLQVIVESVRPRGRGALLEKLELLKAKLDAEGLFSQARKRPLPPDSAVVGVVTSRTGAVIHDIIRVCFRRGDPRILLAPAIVQGTEAVDSLIRGLDLIEQVADLDVIIIGRGGGSFEDLLPFYDERLVRRIAACSVPVVSAVGHEVDLTFSDLVADKSAATPSQAAELVVADKQSSARSLQHLRSRLIKAFSVYLRDSAMAQERLVRRLGDPHDWINERRIHIDDLTQRSADVVRAKLFSQRKIQALWFRRLAARHPRAVLVQQRARLLELTARLVNAAKNRVTDQRSVWERYATNLQALSPLAVLDRGYALVSTDDGELVMSVSQVDVAQLLDIRLRQGRIRSTVSQVFDDEER